MVASLLVGAGLAAGVGAAVDLRARQRERRATSAHPPEGEVLTLEDGRQVHAVVEGAGPDVVLIHGAGGNARDFTLSFTAHLRDRYRVIAMDRPGFGYTDPLPDDESPAAQARLLATAARLLGADRPIVLGHSYGGAVALAWGLEQEAAALVVLGGVSMPWPGGVGRLYEVSASLLGSALAVPLITAFAPRRHADQALERIFAPQEVPKGYAEGFGVGLTLRRRSLRANARQVKALRDHIVELSRRYGQLQEPVEVVHGTHDRIVPFAVHAEPLVRALPDARLTRLEGIGHMPHHAAPDRVAAAVDRAAERAGLI